MSSNPIASKAIVVTEKEPYWVPELERQFTSPTRWHSSTRPNELVIRSSHALVDLERLVEMYSGSVFLLDLNVGPAAALRWIQRIRRLVPAPPFAIIDSGTAGELEWVFRELGAASFYAETPSPPELTNWIDRQFQRAA
jgi:hypothetical protein